MQVTSNIIITQSHIKNNLDSHCRSACRETRERSHSPSTLEYCISLLKLPNWITFSVPYHTHRKSSLQYKPHPSALLQGVFPLYLLQPQTFQLVALYSSSNDLGLLARQNALVCICVFKCLAILSFFKERPVTPVIEDGLKFLTAQILCLKPLHKSERVLLDQTLLCIAATFSKDQNLNSRFALFPHTHYTCHFASFQPSSCHGLIFHTFQL